MGGIAMMLARTLVVASALATSAQAADWNFAFNQGIAEYSVGSFEPGGNSVSLSCSENGVGAGGVDVRVRRAGFAPTAHTPVTFSVGKRAVTMFTDTEGAVSYASLAVAPRFRQLWQLLRTGTRLSVRFGPGAPVLFPLGGAAQLLGPAPCPKQLAGN